MKYIKSYEKMNLINNADFISFLVGTDPIKLNMRMKIGLQGNIPTSCIIKNVYAKREVYNWGGKFFVNEIFVKYHNLVDDKIESKDIKRLKKDQIERILDEVYSIITTYDYQKDFLTKYPERYKDLKSFGYADGIEDEFSYLFDAENMGLF